MQLYLTERLAEEHLRDVLRTARLQSPGGRYWCRPPSGAERRRRPRMPVERAQRRAGRLLGTDTHDLVFVGRPSGSVAQFVCYAPNETAR